MRKLYHVQFECNLDGHPVEGYVVNPGEWFGEPLWLIQVAIANALNPFVLVEASCESDAIDVLADSDHFGHLINLDEDDIDSDENNVFRAGNDGHPVCLDNVHIQPAPADLTYVVRWSPARYEISSDI